MYSAQSPLTRQYVYVLGIFGVVVLASTLIRMARAGVPRPRLSWPTGADLVNAMGWLIVAVMVWVSMSRLK